MSDLAEVLRIQNQLPRAVEHGDFEQVYSTLASNPEHAAVCRRLEEQIDEYFSKLELPSEPTIYDYLVLSLRPKDVLATFNWDPFLVRAAQRAYRAGTKPPELVFLHGNVAVGSCPRDRREGPVGRPCSVCGQPFAPSRLLYPIAEKNYSNDAQIAAAWTTVHSAFKHAFMVTIFGYSAPESDAAAIELLRKAWGSSEEREIEQFEIIDISDPAELRATWDDFIHTHHYEVHHDFFASFIASYPRRTGEAYWRQNMEGKWVHPNPAPRNVSLDELRRWYIPLQDVELREAHGD